MSSLPPDLQFVLRCFFYQQYYSKVVCVQFDMISFHHKIFDISIAAGKTSCSPMECALPCLPITYDTANEARRAAFGVEQCWWKIVCRDFNSDRLRSKYSRSLLARVACLIVKWRLNLFCLILSWAKISAQITQCGFLFSKLPVYGNLGLM